MLDPILGKAPSPAAPQISQFVRHRIVHQQLVDGATLHATVPSPAVAGRTQWDAKLMDFILGGPVKNNLPPYDWVE
jgi:hypothetical protein